MPKEFPSPRYGNDYQQTKEYHNMFQYLCFDATAQDLQEIFDKLFTLPVETAQGGKNKGHETIQEHFWLWRKGTARFKIEQYLLALIGEKVNKE